MGTFLEFLNCTPHCYVLFLMLGNRTPALLVRCIEITRQLEQQAQEQCFAQALFEAFLLIMPQLGDTHMS